MTSILIDTNVLLDIVEDRAPWIGWSLKRVRQARLTGQIVINPIIYAEAAIPYPTSEVLDDLLSGLRLVREGLPWEAAFVAGKAHLAYRQRGGTKTHTLPDFFIAAHALVKSYALVTRDAARFRHYFPALAIIAPDTHP